VLHNVFLVVFSIVEIWGNFLMMFWKTCQTRFQWNFRKLTVQQHLKARDHMRNMLKTNDKVC